VFIHTVLWWCGWSDLNTTYLLCLTGSFYTVAWRLPLHAFALFMWFNRPWFVVQSARRRPSAARRFAHAAPDGRARSPLSPFKLWVTRHSCYNAIYMPSSLSLRVDVDFSPTALPSLPACDTRTAPFMPVCAIISTWA